MGEEADGQYMLPEDYAALFVQWASALHHLDPRLKLGGPSFQGVNKDIEVWPGDVPMFVTEGNLSSGASETYQDIFPGLWLARIAARRGRQGRLFLPTLVCMVRQSYLSRFFANEITFTDARPTSDGRRVQNMRLHRIFYICGFHELLNPVCNAPQRRGLWLC
jgi:hypothetical protein